MTNREFIEEFDLLYNNAANTAPGLDEYEKSLFLTQAQEYVILDLYNGNSSGYPFETNTEVTKYLSNIIKTVRIKVNNDTLISDFLPHQDEKNSFINNDNQTLDFVRVIHKEDLPEDIWLIIYEEMLVDYSKSDCKQSVLVKPVTHDELYRLIRNPFKSYNDRRILKLTSNNGNFEFYGKSDKKFKDYIVRYIRKPKPIKLSSQEEDYNKEVCELDSSIHRTILLRAVQIAKSVWLTWQQK